jgi:hypothetical protein
LQDIGFYVIEYVIKYFTSELGIFGIEMQFKKQRPSASRKEKKELLRLLRSRETQLSNLNEKYWTIIGSGSIGDKAAQLLKKSWAIERAGFALNPRVVLAMGFFDGYKKTGKFSDQKMKLLLRLVKQYHLNFRRIPFAIRSSAFGDASGTGVYKSEFSANLRNEQKTLQGLVKVIKEVLASEFTEDAIDFRRDVGLSNGMAVIIEPVFGQVVMRHNRELYGPLIGGIGYTPSCPGGGHLFFGAGLPINAVKGKGVRIDFDEPRTLQEIEVEEYERLCHNLVFRDMPDHFNEGDFLFMHKWESVNAHIPSNPLSNMSMAWLFTKLRILEDILGAPQYVEWAAVSFDGKPSATILQIADASKELSSQDLHPIVVSDRTVIEANYVRGSGRVECDKVLLVTDMRSIPLLNRLNKQFENHIIVFTSKLLTSASGTAISYSDVNNAKVLVEIPPDAGAQISHRDSPEGHFKGLLDTTKKIFLIGDIFWQRLPPPEIVRDEAGGKVIIYDACVCVTASERQQKAVVELLE